MKNPSIAGSSQVSLWLPLLIHPLILSFLLGVPAPINLPWLFTVSLLFSGFSWGRQDSRSDTRILLSHCHFTSFFLVQDSISFSFCSSSITTLPQDLCSFLLPQHASRQISFLIQPLWHVKFSNVYLSLDYYTIPTKFLLSTSSIHHVGFSNKQQHHMLPSSSFVSLCHLALNPPTTTASAING